MPTEHAAWSCAPKPCSWKRHRPASDAEGKPFVIGNCQAGWAVMMVAATRPELFVPIIIHSSPLPYWAGVEDNNLMRYTGGLAGDIWITALVSDLDNSKFNGGYEVKHFEKQNPANTLWAKNYGLWSNVDSEGPRYLEFEKWWVTMSISTPKRFSGSSTNQTGQTGR